MTINEDATAIAEHAALPESTSRQDAGISGMHRRSVQPDDISMATTVMRKSVADFDVQPLDFAAILGASSADSNEDRKEENTHDDDLLSASGRQVIDLEGKPIVYTCSAAGGV